MRRAPEDPTRTRRDAPPWRWLGTPSPPRYGRWTALFGLVMLAGLLVLIGGRVPTPALSTEDGMATHAPVLAAVRVTPRSEAERETVLTRAIDVWSEHVAEPTLDVVLDPEGLAWLHTQGLAWQVLVPDVEAVAAAERERLEAVAVAEAQRPPTPDQWFSEYRDLPAIHAYLEDLAALRPDLATVQTLGTSLQGRPLLALRIHGQGGGQAGGQGESQHQPRRRMLIDSGLHAREWISMMVTTCVADRLVRGYADDPRLRRFVDEVELVVLPVSNPDGYEHSWHRDRYWRKNRRDEHGVDLNRNFGLAWGGEGSSDKPASQVYRGSAPFSEPESQAIASAMEAERFDAHVDFHSYGQLLLHPWSHTKKPAADHAYLHALAKDMGDAIRAQHGERYRLIAGASLYPAAGTLMDWAYGTRGTPSFVIELRPRGGTGFVLPPEQIRPTCDEGLAAVLALAEGLAP